MSHHLDCALRVDEWEAQGLVIKICSGFWRLADFFWIIIFLFFYSETSGTEKHLSAKKKLRTNTFTATPEMELA